MLEIQQNYRYRCISRPACVSINHLENQGSSPNESGKYTFPFPADEDEVYQMSESWKNENECGMKSESKTYETTAAHHSAIASCHLNAEPPERASYPTDSPAESIRKE